MLLLLVTLRLFCGFSYVFSSLHLVLRGREDVAHAVSRPSLLLCPNPGTLKNAQFIRPRIFASHSFIAVVSLIFGRRCAAIVGRLGAIWQVVAVLRVKDGEGRVIITLSPKA